MAEISSSDVVKLRKMSGQGMMDCKIALAEANGDMDKAMEVLRKKGLATLAKRAERETTEGIVIEWKSLNGKMAGLAVLRCETDFAARSDDFAKLVNDIKEAVEKSNADEGGDNLRQTIVNGRKLGDMLTEVAGKTGEKVQLVQKEYERYKLTGPGLIATYLHFNGKVGAMVQIDTNDDAVAASEVMKQTARDIAMHITAANPLALDKTGIDAKTIESEKSIYAEQVKNKPANIVEKIVEGKLQKFLAENCLLYQQFVKDNTKTVSAVLDEAAKKADGKAKITKFVRFSVG